KKLSKDFINLLLINTIIPLKFAYAQAKGADVNEELFGMMIALPQERNRIVAKFGDLGRRATSALESQAQIQLYKAYCTQNKCLQCAVGIQLLGRKP
ncbi:MAG: DUF2851 family protein, partial [Bacteroidota bacterium]